MPAIIKVSKLTKEFGEIHAVNDLTFTVEQGEVYGFLGQNGAGKSTTIRMLLTLINPTSGDIEIFVLILKKHRIEVLKKLGAIIEKPDLYKYLTAFENLKIFAAMSGVKLKKGKLMEQLAMVGLAERADSKVKTYSQGMKQRLGIAVALIHDPELIILDEPINGLDPQGMADVRKLIHHLSKELGKTLFISSHLLSEMELIADSMLIIDKGKKIVEGKKNELLNPSQIQVEIETLSVDRALGEIRNSRWLRNLQKVSGEKILLKMNRDEIPDLFRELAKMDIDLVSVRPKHSLEDYFLSLTAH
jgi:ABC-type multidrug transport system ATPase subunit